MATEQAVEFVAENLEDAAKVTRQLNTPAIGLGIGGLVVGVAVGFYFGRRWNKEKIRAEAFEKSQEEIEKIREFYQEKAGSVKIVEEKPSLDDVVEEKGYGGPPMVVERPTRPPVPVQEPTIFPKRDYARPGIAKRHVDREKDKNEGWDYGDELTKRTDDRPYIIHQDEFAQREEGYETETLTYYAVDGILTDEQEQPVDNPDELVGLDNLGNFGHGADDYHVVYVRNDRLENDYEICLLAASYAETVQGLSNDATD
jgi:hypothetical protein